MNIRLAHHARLKPALHSQLRKNKKLGHRGDKAFLPAALEILETPPSPVGIWLIWIICLLVIAALSWTYFGRIDVIATAQGKIQPTGRVKVIQPMETAKAVSVPVENGQHVKKGDILVVFDSADADADVNQLVAHLAAMQAEAARRRAALASIEDRQVEPMEPVLWAADIPLDIQRREKQVMIGDLEELVASVASYDAQIQQKERERDRYEATANALQELVNTLQEKLDLRMSLQNSGSGSRFDMMQSMLDLQEQKASLATTLGQKHEAEAALNVLKRDIEDTYQTFASGYLQKLADCERQIDEDVQKLAKARARQDRMVLKSPIDGSVSALSITTTGQIVSAGDEVMRIVPDGLGLEIEAYIANRDISFIRPGQDAVVKIESLPFTRYGTVSATLTKVATDAIPEPDAEQTEANPAKSTSKQALFAGAQRTQNLVYPAIIRPQAISVMADGALVPLSAGMAVTVEIKTGSRRILEYLFSPLLEVTNEAMKER